MIDSLTPHMPLIFLGLMAVSMLIYAILDGYDLGVGILMHLTDEAAERDRIIASIGPFWDANETWLVLGVGILLVAFPVAHGVVLTALYVPVAVMLFGLILRGVAFDFRAKAGLWQKGWWDKAFSLGSLIATLAQGYMLGVYVMGLEETWQAVVFGLISAVCVSAAYVFIGAAWLIYKTEGALQRKAIIWCKQALIFAMLGVVLVSVINPIISPRIFAKWFGPNAPWWLYLLPIINLVVVVGVWFSLRRLSVRQSDGELRPLLGGVIINICAFTGLGYSFFPYVVPGRITAIEAASSSEALLVIFYGVVVVLPTIFVYTIMSYYIFRGKATDLSYE